VHYDKLGCFASCTDSVTREWFEITHLQSKR
jgi:hypothetical protein